MASLIYHSKFLKECFGDGRPLFHQPLFTRVVNTDLGKGTMVDLLFGRILVGRNYYMQTNLQATGIPDHLSIAHEVKCLRESVKKFEV